MLSTALHILELSYKVCSLLFLTLVSEAIVIGQILDLDFSTELCVWRIPGLKKKRILKTLYV